MDICDALKQVRAMRQCERMLEERRARLRGLMERSTGGPYRAGGLGGRQDDRMARLMGEMEAVEELIVARALETAQAIMRVEQALTALRSPAYEVMVMRYIQGMEWEAIARETRYDVSYCYKLHRKALDFLAGGGAGG